MDNGIVRNNHFHRNGNLAADAKQSYKHNVSQNNIIFIGNQLVERGSMTDGLEGIGAVTDAKLFTGW